MLSNKSISLLCPLALASTLWVFMTMHACRALGRQIQGVLGVSGIPWKLMLDDQVNQARGTACMQLLHGRLELKPFPASLDLREAPADQHRTWCTECETAGGMEEWFPRCSSSDSILSNTAAAGHNAFLTRSASHHRQMTHEVQISVQHLQGCWLAFWQRKAITFSGILKNLV